MQPLDALFRSLTLQHIQTFWQEEFFFKENKKPPLPFCSLKEVHGEKKENEYERENSFIISVGNSNPPVAAAKN